LGAGEFFFSLLSSYLFLAFIFSVPVMTTIPRTSSDLVQISRAEQHKQHLLELETEQAAEEAEVLKMTEVNGPYYSAFPMLIVIFKMLGTTTDSFEVIYLGQGRIH
jgi:hypothetical protein